MKRIFAKFLMGIAVFTMAVTAIPHLAGSDTAFAKYEDIEYDKSQYVYLSDISPVQGTPVTDLNGSGSTINLNYNDNVEVFVKGVSVFAQNEYVYNLSALEYKYDYFRAYVGVDSRQINTYYNNGANGIVYTSPDGVTWTKVWETGRKYGWDEAEYMDIPITGVNYIKIEGNALGNNWWSAWYDDVVFADAKLVKTEYTGVVTPISEILTLEEYDNRIKADQSNALLVLQREFVRSVGYDNLQTLVNYAPAYKETVSWLMNDQYNLEMYLHGGRPDGSYSQSIKVLYLLLKNYKNDLDDPINGDLYRRMIISLSLTHAGNVNLWVGGGSADPDAPNSSNALKRYQIYKELHAEKRLDPIFDTLMVSEMRFVMDADIDDESIKWLNWYVTNKKGGARGPYSYINYTMDYNYSLDKYYDEDNKTKWDELYSLTEYGITYKEGYPKLWVVWQEGSVCGGLSQTGTNIQEVFGVPAALIGQPGHAAYIYMGYDKDNNKVWYTGNDITGWSQSEKGGYLFNWGDGNYPKGRFFASYQILGQAAVADYENYKLAEQKVLIANSYINNFSEAEKLYREAIAIQNFNLDAWVGLIELYLSNNVPEEKLIELAQDIADTYTYYPVVCYDMINYIKTGITLVPNQANVESILTGALTAAKNCKDKDFLQASAARNVANYLLGNTDASVAEFSFDGENANKIILNEKYGENQWEYSLDNGENWTTVNTRETTLTKDEAQSITSEMGIAIRFFGSPVIFTLEIGKSELNMEKTYLNDLENAFFGELDNLEWRKNEGDAWTSFEDKTPDLSGDTSVQLRVGYHANNVPSDPETFEFKENNTDDTHRYIPISDVSLKYFDTQEKEKNMLASYVIDGNRYTKWQSNRSPNLKNRYIIFKLEDTKYLSGMDYVPRVDYNDKGELNTTGAIKKIRISVGNADNDFTEVITGPVWGKDTEIKSLTFEPVPARYIKIEGLETYDEIMSAAMFNFYSDETKVAPPTADIEYEGYVGWPTTESVTVRLVNESREIVVTNNGGSKEYTFYDNGEFTFEFKDADGNKGTATAEVNWIVKDSPTVEVTYSTTDSTEDPVTVYIRSDSAIYINDEEDNPDYVYDDFEIIDYDEEYQPIAYAYTAEYNKSFEFKYWSMGGGYESVDVAVTWITKVRPVGNITYSTTNPTNGEVIATFNMSEGYEITNPDGLNTHTFSDNGKYTFNYHSDEYNVDGSIDAVVTWIDKVPPSVHIEYSDSSIGSGAGAVKRIKATVVSDNGEPIIIKNNAGYEYKNFVKSDLIMEYTFLVADEAGNTVEVKAEIVDFDGMFSSPDPEDPEEGEEGEETPTTIPLTGISLLRGSISLSEGQTTSLDAIMQPLNANDIGEGEKVTWESSNEEVATVDEDGHIEAISAGQAVITARLKGFSATCSVFVSKAVIEVTGITIVGGDLEISLPATPIVLNANVSPAGASSTVTWKVDGPEGVISLGQSGRIIPLGLGTVKVSATASNGVTTEITVKVVMHEHRYDTAYTRNDTHHWHKCLVDGCTEKANRLTGYTAHSYQNIVSNSTFISAATTEEAAKYYKSCVCGKVSDETFYSGSPLAGETGEGTGSGQGTGSNQDTGTGAGTGSGQGTGTGTGAGTTPSGNNTTGIPSGGGGGGSSAPAVNAVVNIAAMPAINSVSEDGKLTVDVSNNSMAKEVVLSKTLAQEITNELKKADNKAKSFEIITKNVSVTLDAKAMEAMVSKAAGNEIRVVIENNNLSELTSAKKTAITNTTGVTESAILQSFKVYIESNGKRINNFDKGTVTIGKLDFNPRPGQVGKHFFVIRVNDDNTTTRLYTWVEGSAIFFRANNL